MAMKNERGNNRKRNRDPRMPPCSLDGGMFAHNLAGRLVKHETEAEKSKRGRIKFVEGQRSRKAVDVQEFQGHAWPKRPHFDWRRICVARTDKQTLRMRQKLPPKQVNPLVYSPRRESGLVYVAPSSPPLYRFRIPVPQRSLMATPR